MHRIPDFIIAGAARAGTTWLCELLQRHPDIGLAQPIAPEPKFFLVDELFLQGLNYYSTRWFDTLHKRVIGEKSTSYLESAVAARRICEALPSVRLVFVLRDPVDRAFSNFKWSKMNGHEKETFAAAIELEGKRPIAQNLRYARPFDYLARGRYAELLQPYIDHLGTDQILLIRFDDVEAKPCDTAARVHRFLGLAERPGDAAGLLAVNRAADDQMPVEVRGRLARHFAEPDRQLARLTGLDISGWCSQMLHCQSGGSP